MSMNINFVAYDEETGEAVEFYPQPGLHSFCPLPESSKLVLQLKLGKELLESVPEQYRDRVVGFGLKRNHNGQYIDPEVMSDSYDSMYQTTSTWYGVLLAPKPAPSPKTDGELLADVVDAYERLYTGDGPAVYAAAIQAAKERRLKRPGSIW